MARSWEHLAWDSAFFGFSTARILPDRLGEAELGNLLAEMRASGVVLAYWSADPSDPSGPAAADKLGGFPADDRITYACDLPARAIEAYKPSPAHAETGPGFSIVPVSEADKSRLQVPLDNLGLRSGMHSRFRVDPRFPQDAFRRLYGEWMRKSLTGEMADAVLVALGQGGSASGSVVSAAGPDKSAAWPELQGLVTVSARGGEGRIGLLAIADGCEGRGLGTALSAAALDWFAKAGCRAGKVVTQGRNKAACRVYEKAGFVLERREDVRHFWVGDPP